MNIALSKCQYTCIYFACLTLRKLLYYRKSWIQTPQLFPFFLLLIFVWLLFEGGMYFLGKPADTNDGWTTYVKAIQ